MKFYAKNLILILTQKLKMAGLDIFKFFIAESSLHL